ncbi:MAG: hypothetical protein E3J72_03880 [Planctomycetota bacterium]|nr:MAG: hypothetical protein E3J72_03880 [Planctomycetota bacterium]
MDEKKKEVGKEEEIPAGGDQKPPKKEIRAKIVLEGIRDTERIFSNYAIATRDEGEMVVTFCEVEPFYSMLESSYKSEDSEEANLKAKPLASIRMPLRMIPKLIKMLNTVMNDMGARSE